MAAQTQTVKDDIQQIAEHLAAEQDRGGVPVFLLGSGISAPVVPTLADLCGWFCSELPEVVDQSDELRRAARQAKAMRDKRSTRREAAELFSLLQEPREPFRSIWRTFSTGFVHGGLLLRAGESFDGVLNVDPTDAHRSVARFATGHGAYIVSLNFDSLTYEALRRLGDADGALMLHSENEIRHYFSASGSTKVVTPVFKIRGDVFSATCTVPQCPLALSPVPLTGLRPTRVTFGSDAATDAAATPQFLQLELDEVEGLATAAARCPACGAGDLTLRFSFPGYRAKEEAAHPMLWTLRRHVGGAASAIFTVGMSGRWDTYLLDYLFDWALERSIPVVDINTESAEDRFLFSYCAERYPSIDLMAGSMDLSRAGLILLQGSADSILPQLEEAASAVLGARQARACVTNLKPPDSAVQPHDLTSPTYFPDRKEWKLRIAGDGADCEINITPPAATDPSTEIVVDLGIREQLRSISQLALQEVWIGTKVDKHNRWGHSRGAYNVGEIWLQVLERLDRVPAVAFPHRRLDWRGVRLLVGHALVLHDYGHLIFSHVTEHALETIDWIPQGAGAGAGGLERLVLAQRVADDESHLRPSFVYLAEALGWREEEAAAAVQALINGTFGVPWIQAIVNSPVDADKIDYVRFDEEQLRLSKSFPGAVEQQPSLSDSWLSEFLQDQHVNHTGKLCLDGRSARAAADLWRERIVLYDRFYLAPELRVYERIASEIIQLYLIRSTMGDRFCQDKVFPSAPEVPTGFMGRVRGQGETDPIAAKFGSTVAIMEGLHAGMRGPKAEFVPLAWMYESLHDWDGIDSGYRDLLKVGWEMLEGCQSQDDATLALAQSSLVERPLVFPRAQWRTALEALRPVQHSFCREVFIDLVRLPRVLAPAHRWRAGLGPVAPEGLDYQVLVPQGPAATWGPGSMASQPLTDEAVADLERPLARVVVVSPNQASSPSARYVWDCVRTSLIEAGVDLFEDQASG